MLFKKNKRMVDVRELQRRGVVRIPQEVVRPMVPVDKQGFVDMSAKDSSTKGSALNFFSRKSSIQNPSFSSETDGYSKKEVDQKMVELDNKLYKLEQRIELLERKAGVGSGSSSGGGIIGW